MTALTSPSDSLPAHMFRLFWLDVSVTCMIWCVCESQQPLSLKSGPTGKGWLLQLHSRNSTSKVIVWDVFGMKLWWKLWMPLKIAQSFEINVDIKFINVKAPADRNKSLKARKEKLARGNLDQEGPKTQLKTGLGFSTALFCQHLLVKTSCGWKIDTFCSGGHLCLSFLSSDSLVFLPWMPRAFLGGCH